MEFDNFMDGDEAIATVYYNTPLKLIAANENVKIKSVETIARERVEIKTQEGGRVHLKIAIDDLYAKSISEGEVSLWCTAKEQEIMINTRAKVYNKDLSTSETTVVVNAGGRAEVIVADKLKAKVRAAGSIYIYDKPKDVKRDNVFGSKIQIMN